ncbi:solute carrier family 35 member G1-like [Lytechinus pictus]|uniref:solute carrier family 35 member G1-like n=1 Tax=Lytechinus pictus TaxID=7653 RepID=UPI00240E8A47|nr:solute carrier family 35 member G1-like [Lytechinus pictus]
MEVKEKNDVESRSSRHYEPEEKDLPTAKPLLQSSEIYRLSETEGIEAVTLVSTCSRLCKTVARHKGLIWAFFSALAASLTSLVFKLLSGRVSINQIVAFRSGFFILMAIPALVWHKISLNMPFKIWMILSLRGFIGAVSTTCYFYAYQYLDISTAKAVTYSSPLFTALFACLCVKERCNVPTVFFSLTTIVAVVLVVQPSFIFGRGGVSPIGTVIALGASNAIAFSLILLRLLGRYKIHAQVVILVFGCVGVVVSPIMTSALNEWSNPHCGTDRLLVLCICILSYSEWMMVTVALQTDKAAYVAVIRASDVFMTFAFDMVFFGLSPNVLTIVGALGVVASSLGMTLYAHFTYKNEEGDHESNSNV